MCIAFRYIVNMNMVYDSKTLEVFHRLSPEGEIEYAKFLEQKKNELTWKNVICKLKSIFIMNTNN